MNKLMIIGNLANNPELRTTQDGKDVCNFTVAVNRRGAGGQQAADFFRVSAWNRLAQTCINYLAKGRKVMVIGPVTCRAYAGNDGVPRCQMEVMANEVEFLTPKGEGEPAAQAPAQDFMPVQPDEDLPF